MEALFQSERLLYRAVELDQDEDVFVAIQGDEVGFQLSNFTLKVPQSREKASSFMKSVANDQLLGVVICLKSVQGAKPEPIGQLHLSRNSLAHAHHRHTDIGIDIIDRYQGKGYGGEAILWATGWAFEAAGLHRVQLRCFEYNSRALHLYRRLKFKEEGRWREFVWHNGRFWDDIQFSMLDREWQANQTHVGKQDPTVP